jgi:hypothetical protein
MSKSNRYKRPDTINLKPRNPLALHALTRHAGVMKDKREKGGAKNTNRQYKDEE